MTQETRECVPINEHLAQMREVSDRAATMIRKLKKMLSDMELERDLIIIAAAQAGVTLTVPNYLREEGGMGWRIERWEDIAKDETCYRAVKLS